MKRRVKNRYFAIMAPIGFWDRSASYAVLAFISVLLILISTWRPSIIAPLRSGVETLLAPVVNVVSVPFQAGTEFVRDVSGLSTMQERNAQLEAENEKLRLWYQKAQLLQAENESFKSLLNFEDKKDHAFVTARLIADSGASFVKTILVNAGVTQGVQKNQAVLSKGGMIGRVVETNSGASRVLLLSDINSRVPVFIEGMDYQAVLAGNNTDRLELLHLPKDLELKAGDRVITSGRGGVLPSGLPIGKISQDDTGSFYVSLFSDLNRIRYVKILEKPDNSFLKALVKQ